MKILIADDHPMIHRGLRYMLKEEYTNLVCDSVYDGDEVLEKLKTDKYDIVILDVNMPNAENLIFTEYLLKKYPEIKIVIYSLNPERVYALRYLKMGVYAYVEKNASDKEFMAAIEKVSNAHKYFSQSVLDLITSTKILSAKNPFDILSNRELDVAVHLAKGLEYSTIGEILNISPSTVSTYKSRIFEKVGVSKYVEFIDLVNKYLNHM
jgi:DNA-binding NarL/FixJ family response regulator